MNCLGCFPLWEPPKAGGRAEFVTRSPRRAQPQVVERTPLLKARRPVVVQDRLCALHCTRKFSLWSHLINRLENLPKVTEIVKWWSPNLKTSKTFVGRRQVVVSWGGKSHMLNLNFMSSCIALACHLGCTQESPGETLKLPTPGSHPRYSDLIVL